MSTVEISKKMTDQEKRALKNVYLVFKSYMNNFYNTSGFVWNEDGSDYDKNGCYNMYNNVKAALESEYIDLKRTVYDELKRFIEVDLPYTLEGEWFPEDGETREQVAGQACEMYYEYTEQFENIVNPYIV